MRILISLLLIFSFPLTAFASTNVSRLVGYIEFPTGLKFWENYPTDWVLVAAQLLPGDIELYDEPTSDSNLVVMMRNFDELTLSNFAFSTAATVNVYGKSPGWLQVKTTSNQLLWMKHDKPEHYSSLQDTLENSWYIGIGPDQIPLTSSNKNASGLKIIDTRSPAYESFWLRGYKTVNDELWLELQQETDDHMAFGVYEPGEIEKLPPKGWIKAHGDDGELAFSFISPD